MSHCGLELGSGEREIREGNQAPQLRGDRNIELILHTAERLLFRETLTRVPG